MFNYPVGTGNKFRFMLLFASSLMINVALAAEVEQNRTVRSWSSTGVYSQPSAARVFSSTEMGNEGHNAKQPSYRSTRSIEAGKELVDMALLPAGYCGCVERIEPILLDTAGGNYMDGMIIGTVVLPAGVGQKGAGFFTDVAVPADSGYVPLERNIAEPVYYQISLLAKDGKRYEVTQSLPPQFALGELVQLNRNGVLEKSGCSER